VGLYRSVQQRTNRDGNLVGGLGLGVNRRLGSTNTVHVWVMGRGRVGGRGGLRMSVSLASKKSEFSLVQ